MSLFLPFNFKPDSTVVRTGEYTIPVGRYAFVYDNSNSLIIDGTDVGYTDPVEVYNKTTTTNETKTNIYTAPTNVNLTLSYEISANSTGSNTGSISFSLIKNSNKDYNSVVDIINGNSTIYTDSTSAQAEGPIFKRNVISEIYLRKNENLFLTSARNIPSGTSVTMNLSIYEETIKGSDQIWIPVNEGTVLNGQNYTVVEYIIP